MQLLLDANAELLRDALPLIDLRAPNEFRKGAFPNAISLPLLTDEERHRVGERYKQAGQSAAIALGEQLVSHEIRAQRVQCWQTAVRDNARAGKPAALMCWRGGLRSEVVQRWLLEAGVEVPRIAGGYKALRHVAIDALNGAEHQPRPVYVLGGPTGSGKTALLHLLGATIDLEALAHHRGSAFGGHAQEQPSQTTFENSLACALLRHWNEPWRATLYEDESRNVGRTAIPEPVFTRLRLSPLVIVEVPLPKRALHIQREYVHEPLQQMVDAGTTAAHRTLAVRLGEALARIRRRLGNVRHDLIHADLLAAFEVHETTGNADAHLPWITQLLEHYYDPMYAYQLEKQRARIVFRGDTGAVHDFLGRQTAAG